MSDNRALINPVTPENKRDFYKGESGKMATILSHGAVEVAGAELGYTIELPQQQRYDGFAVIAPGFGGFKRTSKSLRAEMAALGFATVTYSPIRSENFNAWARLSDSQEAHTLSIAAIAQGIRDNSPEIIANTGNKNFDATRNILIPHSMGALATAEFANNQNSSTTDAIVHLAGAGFGSPTISKLAKDLPLGIPKGIYQELLPYLLGGTLQVTPKNSWQIISYFVQNPVRTIGEIVACLSTDIRPTIYNLRENGVLCSFIAFQHDTLVPPDGKIMDYVDYYSVMSDTGHLAPLLKSHKVARKVAESLEYLEVI